MIYCFDIDGTLCSTVHNGNYHDAIPIFKRISHVNFLYNHGNHIIIFTARGSTTGINWRKATVAQLHDWGLLYHQLILGKPEADVFIDDKAFNAEDFVWN